MPVALITGASRGIGRHLALGLAAQGWQVAGLARDEARLEELRREAAGLLTVRCDVTERDEVTSAVDRVREEFGTPDLLINNAGLNHPEAPLWEIDPDQWWQVVAANVRGPFLFTHALVPHMIAAGGGRIININSGAGVRDYAQLSAYNASKTALCRITTATADAGAKDGIRAFDLSPGVVRTDMTAGMGSHRDRTEWTDPADVLALVLALAGGELDHFSGRMVRAGADRIEDLRARAGELAADARRLRLTPWGDDDPLG